MPDFVIRVFVRAVRARLETGEESLNEILNSYPKLSEEDREEISKQIDNKNI